MTCLRRLIDVRSTPANCVGEFDELLRREALVIVAQAPSLGIELRDPDDVAVLVTGDRDLLDAADVAPLRILTPRELWELLREG